MSRSIPVRTCVGCRERVVKSDLLRVVLEARGSEQVAVPDPTARKPGRGAHLHPDRSCLDQAERRRAFARALRLDGPLDVSALRLWIEAHTEAPPGATVPADRRKRSSGS